MITVQKGVINNQGKFIPGSGRMRSWTSMLCNMVVTCVLASVVGVAHSSSFPAFSPPMPQMMRLRGGGFIAESFAPSPNSSAVEQCLHCAVVIISMSSAIESVLADQWSVIRHRPAPPEQGGGLRGAILTRRRRAAQVGQLLGAAAYTPRIVFLAGDDQCGVSRLAPTHHVINATTHSTSCVRPHAAQPAEGHEASGHIRPIAWLLRRRLPSCMVCRERVALLPAARLGCGWCLLGGVSRGPTRHALTLHMHEEPECRSSQSGVICTAD
jgi:hypothetical protein